MKGCEYDQITLYKILKEQNSSELLKKGESTLMNTAASAARLKATPSEFPCLEPHHLQARMLRLLPVCPVRNPLISFTCLTVLAKTSSRILSPKRDI